MQTQEHMSRECAAPVDCHCEGGPPSVVSLLGLSRQEIWILGETYCFLSVALNFFLNYGSRWQPTPFLAAGGVLSTV